MSEEQFLLFMKILTGILVGGTLGSFITMLSYRLPRKLSIVTPGSFCPSCNTPLGVRDLVPVFSYLAFKGACRTCKTPIGPRYVTIELISIVAVTVIMLAGGFSFISFLLCLGFIAAFTSALILIERKK